MLGLGSTLVNESFVGGPTQVVWEDITAIAVQDRNDTDSVYVSFTASLTNSFSNFFGTSDPIYQRVNGDVVFSAQFDRIENGASVASSTVNNCNLYYLDQQAGNNIYLVSESTASSITVLDFITNGSALFDFSDLDGTDITAGVDPQTNALYRVTLTAEIPGFTPTLTRASQDYALVTP